VIVGLRPGLVNLPLLLSLSLSVSVLGGVVEVAVAVETSGLDAKLSARGIRDTRVLEAFANVPRDVFVPRDSPERSFDEKPLPAGFTQVISQPYLLARMVEALQLKPDARVLEVGGGTGYPAAILSKLAGAVFSVGAIPELATTARLRLAREGCQNVHVKLGNGAEGWREYGPYDAVIVTSIGAKVPPALIDQLVEGGVLVMPVGPPRGRQVLLRGVRKGFKLHAKELAELRAAPDDVRAPGADHRDAGAAPAVRREPAETVTEKRPPRDSDELRNDR
jgi:protein-L-isoaspartate(D-aspartate) O-methyltransferase